MLGDNLLGQEEVARGTAAVGVIEDYWQAVAGRLAQAHIARYHRVEHHIAEMALQLLIDLIGEA